MTTQTNHLSVAGASEVGLQTIKGCYFPLCLIFDALFGDLFLYRLKVGLVDYYGITVLAGVAGIFENTLYLVLVPERRFGGEWDILPIQRIRDILVGSTGVVEGKHHANDLLFLGDDRQGTIMDLVAIQNFSIRHLTVTSKRSVSSSPPWRRNRSVVWDSATIFSTRLSKRSSSKASS